MRRATPLIVARRGSPYGDTRQHRPDATRTAALGGGVITPLPTDPTAHTWDSGQITVAQMAWPPLSATEMIPHVTDNRTRVTVACCSTWTSNCIPPPAVFYFFFSVNATFLSFWEWRQQIGLEWRYQTDKRRRLPVMRIFFFFFSFRQRCGESRDRQMYAFDVFSLF